jgi:hypothetical protein
MAKPKPGQQQGGGRPGGGQKDGAAPAAPVQDQRFARLHTDPRFARDLSRAKQTVEIDERFARMFRSFIALCFAMTLDGGKEVQHTYLFAWVSLFVQVCSMMLTSRPRLL